MILGLGVDLFEVGRLRREIERHGASWLDAVLSPTEQCDPRGRRRAIPALAGCFAAKEAFFKALGSGLAGGTPWLQVEIDRPADARPRARPTGAVRRAIERRGVERIHVSIGPGRRWAVAAVVLEGSGPRSAPFEED